MRMIQGLFAALILAISLSASAGSGSVGSALVSARTNQFDRSFSDIYAGAYSCAGQTYQLRRNVLYQNGNRVLNVAIVCSGDGSGCSLWTGSYEMVGYKIGDCELVSQ